MSRTYKDRPSRLKYDDKDRQYFKYIAEWLSIWGDVREYEFTYSLQTKTTKPKKRKELDTEFHWMSTPSWWTHTRMIKPQRRKGSMWEREVVKTQVPELEEVDKPNVSRKPHVYYW